MNTAQLKLLRLQKALSHQEGDRVPVSDFFWTGFIRRCRQKWGSDFDPYRHFDLDYIVVNPNMDPQIQPFEVIRQSDDEIVVKTGFGATIRRCGEYPMPAFDAFSVNTPEAMTDFPLEEPANSRRFFEGGDDQINCIGDTLARDIPAWSERMKPYWDNFPIFGSVCEPYEYLWRIVGSENAMLWMATAPDKLAAFIDRIGQFMYKLGKAQIAAGKGRLSGMYIWGDVAYRNGMLFGAARWREWFKPHVKALVDLFHSHGLLVIYHGCGDARDIFDDMVELGLDGYNPVEAKAGLDVVELKQRYTGKLAFVGNLDIRILEKNHPEAIQQEILYKLRSAKGGGWICQSDHSVTSAVSPESYEWIMQVLRENGSYPLHL